MTDPTPTIADQVKKRIKEILSRLGVPMSCPTCGMSLTAKHSEPERRRHWGVIRAAWDHWPADTKLMDQITGPEDLRAWLYVKVGYRNKIDFPINPGQPDRSVDCLLEMARLFEKKVFARVLPDGKTIRVYIPKSAKKKHCPHDKFWRLAAMVNDEIETTLGVKTDQLLKEKRRAA